MMDLLLALLSAFAGAVVALWTSERKLRLENVTAERAKWRERIRDLAADLITAKDQPERIEAAVGIQLSTNPYDRLDREIIELAWAVARMEAPSDDELQRLLLRMQLLLKHDWERAKIEAEWAAAMPDWLSRLVGRKPQPKRPDFSRFLDWRERHSAGMDQRLPPS